MAWLAIHQELTRHPKTLRTAGDLRVSRHTLMGHLLELWFWALDYADADGAFTGSHAEIAYAAGWDEETGDAFVAALVQHGFLDNVDGVLCIHNWDRYAGRLLAQRKAASERKRRERAVTRTGEVRLAAGGTVAKNATVAAPPDAPVLNEVAQMLLLKFPQADAEMLDEIREFGADYAGRDAEVAAAIVEAKKRTAMGRPFPRNLRLILEAKDEAARAEVFREYREKQALAPSAPSEWWCRACGEKVEGANVPGVARNTHAATHPDWPASERMWEMGKEVKNDV